MSYLINRNPPARLQCLHALCKFIYSKYSTLEAFRMSDIKYNPNAQNIHSFCDILMENKLIGIKYCRYKENPFNMSGCSLTNGISDDTTKSKEVSNTVNSLQALGLLNRVGNQLKLTKEGADFANTPYNSDKMLNIIKNSLLKYGLFVGMMYQIRALNKDVFDTNEITVGYPSANEEISYNGELITISSGSEDDSNTRTKSCLLAWATTAGFICPLPLFDTIDITKPHISTSTYILQTSRNIRKYKVLEVPSILFNGAFITERPLDYKNLTKNIGALREHNQQSIRELTLQLEPKIQNRRFAILYLLNEAFLHKKSLSVTDLIRFFNLHDGLFVIDKKNIYETICEEIKIAFTAGIPFSIQNSDELNPNNGLNVSELALNAPPNLINILNEFKLK